ncbi:hypothetical protein PAMA_016991 [Pampus argenteus]
MYNPLSVRVVVKPHQDDAGALPAGGCRWRSNTVSPLYFQPLPLHVHVQDLCNPFLKKHSMKRNKHYTLHDALEAIMGDDSEFEGCDDSSDEDPDDPLYNPNSQDRESDESTPLVLNLLQRKIYFVGTLRANRLAACQLEDEKSLAKRGRGSVDSRVEKEESMVIVKWYDNKSVILISSYCGVEPQDNAQRWSKADKAFVEKMLVKVEYGGVQKYIKIPHIDEIFDFQKFLQEVLDKFSLQAQLVADGVLSLTDTSETEVDGDTFNELVKSGVKNFKVGYRQHFCGGIRSMCNASPISSIIGRPPTITSLDARLRSTITGFFYFIRFYHYPPTHKEQEDGQERPGS